MLVVIIRRFSLTEVINAEPKRSGSRPACSIEVRQFLRSGETSLHLRMEAAIDAMLVLLDELDGDFDLEPDNDSRGIARMRG